MIISKFVFKNFRSFKNEATLKPTRGLNIIVGENNSGKSNIFRCLKKFQGLYSGTVQFDENDWYYENTSEPINIELEIRPLKEERQEFVKILDNIINDEFKKYQGYLSGFERIRFIFKLDYGLIIRPDIEIGDIRWKESLPNDVFWKNEKINGNETSDLLNPALKLFIVNIKYFEDIRIKPEGKRKQIYECFTGENIANVLFTLKNSEEPVNQSKYQEILEDFNSLFKNFKIDAVENKDLNPYIQFTQQPIGVQLDLEKMGTGVFEILTFLTNIITSRGNIYILEEPENHLHPSMQKSFLNLLEKYSKSNQIFIITHSPYFISFKNIDGIFKVSNRNNCSVIHNFDLNKLIEMKSKRYPNEPITPKSTRARISQSLDISIREGFFGKMVVLVEGPTELLSFRVWAEILGKNFDDNDIIVISTAGKDAMINFAEIFSVFEIPVFLVFDSDEDETKNKKDIEKHKRLNRWLLKFAGADQVDFPEESGSNYHVFSPNYEDCLIREDQNYKKLEQEVSKSFGIVNKKGIKARYVALRYKEDNLHPPENIKILFNSIFEFRKQLD